MKSLNIYSLLVVLLVFSGCNEGSSKFNIHGTVKYDGELVETGSVTFLPAGPGLTQAVAKIVSGAYETTGTEGMIAGNYKVVIKGYQSTGRFSQDPMGGEKKPVLRQIIPPKYNSKSTLLLEVNQEKTEYNFDLESN